MSDTTQLRLVEQLQKLNRNMEKANELNQKRNELIESGLARLLLSAAKKSM